MISKIIKDFPNYNAKLTKQDVIKIHTLWWGSFYTQKEIAKCYNVHRSTVNRIINNKSWIDVFKDKPDLEDF